MTDDDRSMDRLVAEMTDAGAFGPGCTPVSFEPDPRFAGQDQFASTIIYGTVTVLDRTGSRRRYQLVFKFKHPTPELRAMFQSDKQFHNESLFYERLIPFLLDRVPAAGQAVHSATVPPLCRYFYGRNDCGDKTLRDVIVLENASPQGYRLSDFRLFLDFDHLVLALRTLAKFHGLSYRTKHKEPKRFARMVSDIEETQWNQDEWIAPFDLLVRLVSVGLDRLAERRGGGDDDERARRFRTEFLTDWKSALRQTMKSREPLAVLCHGDFNRNNMLFRYDDRGRPVDVMPFDMATVRYASPALDLSFFLYMNTDCRIRDAHWDDLLNVYCAAVAECVSDVSDVIRVPDRTELDAEMRERAFYGLAHASFFLRVMSDEDNQMDLNDYINMIDAEVVVQKVLEIGGDRATDLVADVIHHFLGIRYAE